MTFDSKLGKAAVRAARPRDGAPSTEAQQALLWLLETALGAREPAERLVAMALTRAGKSTLPESAPDVLAFVRTHLIELMNVQMGSQPTVALLADLEARLDPPVPSYVREISVRPTLIGGTRRDPQGGSVPPSSAEEPMAVVLVDADRVGRTALARALVRARCEVTVVDTPGDLNAALDAAEPVDVALVDTSHAASNAILELLVRRRPGVPVVVRSTDVEGARARLTHVTAAWVDVRPDDAPADELIDAMRQALGD